MSENNLSESARRLEAATMTTLADGGLPTEEQISSLATQLRKIPLFEVTDDEFERIIRRLHQALRIDMGIGSKVLDQYTPWLQARKPDIDPFYWRRYQLHLRKQGWAPKVLSALDEVTDELLDLSGDPMGNSGWPRRGLVMGDVQSGKTSNYTAVICKAADVGYRIIILLTGTLESLRRQTQERLDSGFVGLDSSGVLTRNRQRRDIGVGLLNGARAAGVFTSTLLDFRASTVNQLGFRLDAIHEPVLLVVKKNKRILENLADWLQNYNADSNGHVGLPLLLIDDEADNASVNTNPAKATAINASIRRLLRIFPRSAYVGFTATPFANVFIHPESQDEMLGNDLFPKDFVYALEAPTNYLGAVRIFGDDSDLECLVPVTDAEPIFPRAHGSDLRVDHLPDSLVEAVYAFFLTNAIMDLRPDTPKHRSMLVNVSSFTGVQDQVAAQVSQLIRFMQDEIRSYALLSVTEALQNRCIKKLNQTFEKHFSKTDLSWKVVQHTLVRSTLPIEVRSVNQNSGAASLSYSAYDQNGLRVIAVGGNSLARGLTLEGLCTSYFYRSTQMYDTLLQMGRWFGYRPNYEDLIKIWMSEEAINWYTHIAEASEELRQEIKKMQKSRMRPIDFGMKVRAHPDSLLVTARNKMRHSSEITRYLSISGEGLETPRLLNDEPVLDANFKSAVRFVSQLDASGSVRKQDSANPLWSEVPKGSIIELLKNFVAHPLNVAFHPDDLADFLKRSEDPKLAYWDVVIPNGSSQRPPLVLSDTVSIILQKRKIAILREQRSILVNERKMRVGSRGVEKSGMSSEQILLAERSFYSDSENEGKKNVPDRVYRLHRDRPLLILHFLDGMINDVSYELKNKAVLTAIGLSFPVLATKSEKVPYRINLVEMRNMLTEEAQELDEDDEDDEDH